jgi:hypothetical protein
MLKGQIAKLERAARGSGGVCARCGLPTHGRTIGRVIRLREGEEPPAPCPACHSRGLAVVTIRTVSAR